MGYTYTHYCVLGVRFDPSKHKTKVTHRAKAFEHDYPEDYEYCPTTGRKLWNSYQRTRYIFAGTPYEGHERWRGGEDPDMWNPFRGFPAYGVFDEGESGDQSWYMGRVLSWRDNSDDVEFVHDVDIDETAKFIRQQLDLYGLGPLVDDCFGFWFFTHV